ncbi:MAG: DUF1854 domain-containing protein, partial [Clostridia bacterium]|nr:DUF1854 domain-containing protein [Clostridia bacterium]
MKTDDIQTISPETLQTEYVSPAHCIFSLTEYGFLSAEINGEKFGRVILTEAMPLTMPDKYICISDIEKKEIGIIEDISGFGEDQQKLIMSELSQRYYSPVITEILAIKEKFGNFYFDVMIGDYKKNFTVKNLTKNVRYHGDGFDIIDV